jgi:RHS repeat-associated protein
MTNIAMKQRIHNRLNLLFITSSEHSTGMDSTVDLFILLLCYSFLLNDTTELQNSRVQKTPQLNAPQGNIYMGARYLDPKYSRWISVDPALGEYIPAAGKGNSENAGNLPGMGGVFNHINGDLYAYAANNPVKYLDPDGRLVYKNLNNGLCDAIEYLYNNSSTFKKQFNKLLSDKNDINQKCIVIFSTHKDEYAGNTTTNDSPITLEIKTLGLDDKGKIITRTESKTDNEIQAIFVNIDLTRIYSKNLNLYEVLSEEVCHAADCMSYGAELWNEKCKTEDKNFDYKNRPREKYAKELTKKILQEIKDEH